MTIMPEDKMLVIKTGSAPEAICRQFDDFDAWFVRLLQPERFDFNIIRVDEGQALPDHRNEIDLAGVLVTGSPAMVSHGHEWSERTAGWLRQMHARAVPILGVCYGHQLLAHALGGQVGPNPHGRRIGTFDIRVTEHDDPLLHIADDGLPAHSTHVESVLEPPAGARVIATAKGDPHHALYFGEQTWGVQFHPEFDAEIMRAYIRERRELIDAEGLDSGQLFEQVVPAPLGNRLLKRFADLCIQYRTTAHAIGA